MVASNSADIDRSADPRPVSKRLSTAGVIQPEQAYSQTPARSAPRPRRTPFNRSRLIRLSIGFAGLLVLLTRLGQTSAGIGAADIIIWTTTLLAVVLLIWRERNHALAHRETSAEYQRFILAAETSLDAFIILDSIRDDSAVITGFRF